jgi:hypothetical protein
MKTKLLFLLLAIATVSSAQTPITGFYGYINDDFGTSDGIGHRSYLIVAPAIPLDQTATGANLVWNFDQLVVDGTSQYDNAAPTGAEVSTYPGTNRVVTNTRTIGANTTTSKVFFNTWNTTGVSNIDFQVNYTDNAVLTNTTLEYGNTYSDPVAGTFTYDVYSGTFTGTMVTTVDAYGTLTTDDLPWGLDTENVTRMKVIQSLTLSSPPFGVVGTASFTNYYYYRVQDLYPFFNSATSDFNIPLLSIDEEITTYEAAVPVFLGTPTHSRNTIGVAPNPVRNILTINADAAISFQAISIIDVNGRTVMNVNPAERQVDCSSLSNGIYLLKMDSASGSITKKIIKQ